MAIKKLACDRRFDALRNMLASQKLHVACMTALVIYLGNMLAGNF